jgi:hypothetical protein
LTFPVAFATAGPDATRSTLAPVPLRPLLSRSEVNAGARLRLLESEQPAPLRPRPPTPEPAFELVLADRKPIVLPAMPAVKVPPLDPGEVRVASVAIPRDPDRPTVTTDPSQQPGERLLMTRPAPVRTTPTAFEKNTIPDPTPNSAGEIRTVVPDADRPISPPERPEAVKFKVK